MKKERGEERGKIKQLKHHCDSAALVEKKSMAESSTNNGSSSPSSSAITRIGEDQLLSILLLLPIESILWFGMTCKKLKSVAYSDPLWESVCRRDWGNPTVDSIKLNSSYNSRKGWWWKKLYKQVYQLDSVFCHRVVFEDGESDATVVDRRNHLPTPRASHSLNLLSGCLLLFGGGSAGGRHLDDTWIAHIGNDYKRASDWQKVSSGVPSGRFGHSCVVISDTLVLFGGIRDDGIRQNDTWIGRVTFHERRGITLSWKLLDIVGSIMPSPRGAHAGCCISNNQMLIHGGIGPSRVRLGDTWVLELTEDISLGTWREIVTRPCPSPRSGHTVTHIGGAQTILFGGRGLGYEVLNDLWLFDMSERDSRWVQVMFDLCNIPQGFSLPRVGHSACLIVGHRLLIYGGEDSLRNRKSDFWILDVSSIPCVKLQTKNVTSSNRLFRNMWRRVESKGDRPNCRSFHGTCVDHSGQYLYVHGGMVDEVVQPVDSSGLRFDGETFLVELVLHSQG